MSKSTSIMDLLSLVFSFMVVSLVTVWLWNQGVFTLPITENPNLTWYLIRSSGIMAHILLTIAVIWGLALSSQIVKDWSPGVLSMLLHSGISWLAVLLALTHAGLLMFDDYFTYSLSDVLIPFRGPYRPLAVGLGTLTFWITLVVSLSFAVRQRIGRRVWKVLHMTSYIAYVMATAHGLFAGTDAEQPGFRVVMLVGIVLSLVLLGYRLGRQQRVDQQRAKPQSPPKTQPRRAGQQRASERNAVIAFSKEKEA